MKKKSRSVADNISASLKLRKYSRCLAQILALIQSHSDSLWHFGNMFGTDSTTPRKICRGKKVKQEIGIQLQVLDSLNCKQKYLNYIQTSTSMFSGPGKHLAALMERVLTLTIFALHSLLSKVLRRCGCLIHARMHGLII